MTEYDFLGELSFISKGLHVSRHLGEIIEILKLCHALVVVLSLVCDELNRNARLSTTLLL